MEHVERNSEIDTPWTVIWAEWVTVQLPRVLVILQNGVGTDAERVVQVDNLVPQIDASTTVSFGHGVSTLGGEELPFCVEDSSCGACWASWGRLAVCWSTRERENVL